MIVASCCDLLIWAYKPVSATDIFVLSVLSKKITCFSFLFYFTLFSITFLSSLLYSILLNLHRTTHQIHIVNPKVDICGRQTNEAALRS